MSDASDHASLILRSQDGDVRAFEELCAAHIGSVRRFALAFASSDADADDLAQEALIKVYRSIRSYRFQAAFTTWLYAVVRNVFLDAAKSRAAKERAASEPLDAAHRHHDREAGAGPPLPEASVLQEEERRRVWAAVQALPDEIRSTVVLFDIEGFSYDEVAAVEKVALGTVKSRLSRGRERLRRLLGQDPAGVERTAEDGNLGAVPIVKQREKEPA